LSPRDPLVDRQASHSLAWQHFAAARYADCVTWARRTIERYPGHLPRYYALVAAAALQGDSVTASEALTVLLQLRPDLSLTWASQNMAPSGDVLDRLLEGLRRAGVPEKWPARRIG